MVNFGLDIKEEDFSKLPTRQQNTILFQNVQEIKKLVSGWRFRQKLVLAWLSSITTIGTYFIIKLIKL